MNWYQKRGVSYLSKWRRFLVYTYCAIARVRRRGTGFVVSVELNPKNPIVWICLGISAIFAWLIIWAFVVIEMSAKTFVDGWSFAKIMFVNLMNREPMEEIIVKENDFLKIPSDDDEE